MTGETCAACAYFDPQKLIRQYMGVDTGEPPIDAGFCRRHPPRADTVGIGRFPIVGKHDWCGDFSARTVQAIPG